MTPLQRCPDGSWPRAAREGLGAARGRGRFPRSVPASLFDERSGHRTFEVLIVEDDELLATMLKDFIELEEGCRVSDIAHDLAGAIAAIEAHLPGLALVDIHLGGNATGIEVAAKALEHGVPTLFSTGNPLPFPVPEVALGCLCKPYTCYSVAQSLRIARQLIRGGPVDHDVPVELELY